MADAEPRPLHEVPFACAAVLTWLAWGLFGLLHGGHWLVIYFTVAQHAADRQRALLHFASYIVGILLTAMGGGYVRGDGRHHDCTNSTGSMGRDCLWDLQSTDYQVIYVVHFIGLGWCGVCWVYDAAQLPGWLNQGSARRPLRVCYSAWPLTCAVNFTCAPALLRARGESDPRPHPLLAPAPAARRLTWCSLRSAPSG